MLDSLNCTVNGAIHGLPEIDAGRRRNRSDEQISQARAHAVQRLYDVMVEEQQLEGLIFKDLSAPYYLGEESRNMRYWHKFKPDYFKGSIASDLDLVIIGGYYAKGRKLCGKPSALLCACVDPRDSDRFVPVCKVSLLSIDHFQSNALLASTGYPVDKVGENRAANKWQKGDWASKFLPDFVSMGGQQSGNDHNAWRIPKGDCTLPCRVTLCLVG
jgi:hypothetical protein